ncbi:MAG: 7-carboxy-7-deazaguanine synthase QueE [Thermonemataceae bacterium]|nr:7-carboxy-7-deazaguanine synthase QueE [Thermonemataceae bacterium]
MKTQIKPTIRALKEQLPLMEAFYTIQGEGFYQGRAAYFIRLGGCDVGCVWCDVKESWEAENHPIISVEEIVEEAQKYPAKLVVVTGGEPFIYNLELLTETLGNLGIQRNIETSGAYPISGEWDWICFSPKKFKPALDEFYQKAHELKVVIYHASDLEWAEGFAKKMHKEAVLFLQPEWSKQKELLPLIIDYVKKYPHWRISLQTHKFMDIP